MNNGQCQNCGCVTDNFTTVSPPYPNHYDQSVPLTLLCADCAEKMEFLYSSLARHFRSLETEETTYIFKLVLMLLNSSLLNEPTGHRLYSFLKSEQDRLLKKRTDFFRQTASQFDVENALSQAPAHFLEPFCLAMDIYKTFSAVDRNEVAQRMLSTVSDIIEEKKKK